jgi:hypothetical protein
VAEVEIEQRASGERRRSGVVSRTELQFTAIVFPEWITAH